MAYDFKRLSDVEMLNEVPEGATVLAEVNGSIKRVPGEGLGGGGIKTAIIKDSEYNNTIAGISTLTAGPTYTYECINMTFEEAYETMLAGEPLACMLMHSGEGGFNNYGTSVFAGTAMGIPCIMLDFSVHISYFDYDIYYTLFWTADGLSTEQPSSGE